MRPNLPLITVLTVVPLVAMSMLTGCEEKKPTANSAAKPATSAKTDDHGHAHNPDGSHKDDHGHEKTETSGPGHGGAVIALGEQTIGSFSAKATRDQGQIVAGKDAPIDVTLTPTAGASAKAAAVRIWIGTQDAKGSVKAKAEIENSQEPNRWHVHAEIPNPMPAGSKLWVEIEDDKGATIVGGFDLRM